MRIAMALLITVLTATPTLASTYYVSVLGSDSNSGSQSSPWHTIQHAANTAQAGDIVYVKGGFYQERVSMTISGTSSSPIQFIALSNNIVSMQGFQVTANYIIIQGFDISNHNQAAPGFWGIYVVGSNNTIQGNYIHDLCGEGIAVLGSTSGGGVAPNSSSTANNDIQANNIVRADMAGIYIEGQSQNVWDNDVSDTLQHPLNCPSRSGADADGIRLFGSYHKVHNNYIHDIEYSLQTQNSGASSNTNSYLINPSPHTDCFQTWGPLYDTQIYNNLCVWPLNQDGTVEQAEAGNFAPNPNDSNHAISLLAFDNNIFVNMNLGLQLANLGSTIDVLNNTWDNAAAEAVVLDNTPGAEIVNNIFYNVGGSGDTYAYVDTASQSGITVATNDFYKTGGSYGTYGCPNTVCTYFSSNPQFLNEPVFDYRLQSDSGAKDAGTSLSSNATFPLTIDFYGETRPQGSAYDVGATEYPQ